MALQSWYLKQVVCLNSCSSAASMDEFYFFKIILRLNFSKLNQDIFILQQYLRGALISYNNQILTILGHICRDMIIMFEKNNFSPSRRAVLILKFGIVYPPPQQNDSTSWKKKNPKYNIFLVALSASSSCSR